MAQGLLSSREIEQQREVGEIVITPFNFAHLGSCSYDITLGKHYYRANKGMNIYNPWSKSHMERYWGQAQKANTVSTQEESLLTDLPIGAKYIILEPNETILGHTEEYIGGKTRTVAMIQTRSSLARSGLAVCKDSGMGTVGYINRWTMEITNSSGTRLVLPVGLRVAQMIFFWCAPDRPYRGKYQKTTNVQELISSWTPEQMLPRLYMDEDKTA